MNNACRIFKSPGGLPANVKLHFLSKHSVIGRMSVNFDGLSHFLVRSYPLSDTPIGSSFPLKLGTACKHFHFMYFKCPTIYIYYIGFYLFLYFPHFFHFTSQASQNVLIRVARFDIHALFFLVPSCSDVLYTRVDLQIHIGPT